MHTRVKDGNYEDIWEWPSKEVEDSIKDDVRYTVLFERDEWNTEGSLIGDSWGRRTKVTAFEETPKEVTDVLDEINRHKINISLLNRGVMAYEKLFTTIQSKKQQ